MSAMKSLILLGLLCAAGPASAQQTPGRSAFRLDADVARFSTSDSLTYVEIYYGIPEAGISYRRDSSGYRGAAEMTLTLEESSKVIASRRWVLPRVLRDSAEIASPKNILSFESLALPAGEYSIVLSGRDSINPSRLDSIRLPLTIQDRPARIGSLSDIELCSRITPSDDGSSPFYKNTLEVIPNPSRLYGEGLPVLHFYAEVYDLNASPGPDVTLRASIIDGSGRETAFQSKQKPRTHQSSAEYGSMNVGSLPGGSYRFRLALIDTVGQPERIVATSEKRFFVYNPNAELTETPVRTSGQGRDFSFLTELEADDEIRKLRYLTTDADNRQIGQLGDLNGKRSFLANFWTGRSADPGSGRTREEYLARIAAANTSYAERSKEGWLTDRGRIMIVYGKPDDIERHTNMSESRPYESWEYRGIQGGVLFVFVDRLGFGSYRLVHSTHLNELRNENWYQEEAEIR